MSDDAAAIKAAKEAEAIRAAKIAAAKKPVQPTEAQPRPEDDLEMGFFEHVGELRTRLVRAVVGAIPTIFLAWVWKQEILELLLRPWIEAWERLGLGRPTIHFSGPVDMFVIYLKNSVIAGLILASPWVFWQVWGFISPGLYRRERRMAIPFVLASTLFFVGGVAFGYVVVFPEGFRTFLEYAEHGTRALAEAIIGFMRQRQAQHAKPVELPLDTPLSFAQLRLLFHLPADGSIALGRYAESIGITPAALTQALGPIEQAGLVERTRSETDRRVVEARMTDLGRDVLATVRDIFDARWTAALEGIDDDQFATAAFVLGRVAGIFGQASSTSHRAASSDA